MHTKGINKGLCSSKIETHTFDRLMKFLSFIKR